MTLSFSPVFRIDKWLWSMGLGHPQVMPIVRNEILLSVSTLLCGLLLFMDRVYNIKSVKGIYMTL